MCRRRLGWAGGFQINQESATLRVLGPWGEDIFKTRNERVMFVQGDPDVDISDVAAMIDMAKGAGVNKVGLITKAMEEGS